MSVVISVENVSKQYRLGQVGTGTLSHDLNRWWHKVRGKEDPYLKIGEVNDRTRKAKSGKLKAESEVAQSGAPEAISAFNFPLSKFSSDYAWALRDVSFEVKQGEVLGIIGRNGAGKSTLLKILSRVTTPTSGQIKVKGRIASLLEVGTGFHPELTGRENIYINGAILGMRKHEITRKLDEIIDFSGCERYIDTPVKRYSSGMYVRLAFAVAAHLEPEILIVDEVLAVGDAEFQKKCLGKMKDVAGQGRTVLFVSHNMAAIRKLCTSGLLIDRGSIAESGSAAECALAYNSQVSQIRGTILSHLHYIHKNISIADISINGDESDTIFLSSDKTDLMINISGSVAESLHLDVEAKLTDDNGTTLAFFSHAHQMGRTHSLERGDFTICRNIRLPSRMNKGSFLLSINLTEHNRIGWAEMPNCVTIHTEGTPTHVGQVLTYNQDVGWLFLESTE